MLKGWKNVIWGLALATVPAGMEYLGGINWVDYVSPAIAPIIAGIITIALRVVTTTPIFQKRPR